MKPLEFQRAGGSDPDTYALVETAGWGSLDNLGNRPDTLHEVTVAVIKRLICGRSNSYGESFTTNMLCAGKTRKDTCDVSFHLKFKTVSLCYESVIGCALPSFPQILTFPPGSPLMHNIYQPGKVKSNTCFFQDT